jgi:hypothetical protein
MKRFLFSSDRYYEAGGKAAAEATGNEITTQATVSCRINLVMPVSEVSKEVVFDERE